MHASATASPRECSWNAHLGLSPGPRGSVKERRRGSNRVVGVSNTLLSTPVSAASSGVWSSTLSPVKIQRRSACSRAMPRSWVARTTRLRWAWATLRSSAMISAFAAMSRWAVGSSRSVMGAPWASANAIEARCRSPELSETICRVANSCNPTMRMAFTTLRLCWGVYLASQPDFGKSPNWTNSSTLSPGMAGSVAGRKATVLARCRGDNVGTLRPWAKMLPARGASSPESTLRSVDFPVPFNPNTATSCPAYRLADNGEASG